MRSKLTAPPRGPIVRSHAGVWHLRWEDDVRVALRLGRGGWFSSLPMRCDAEGYCEAAYHPRESFPDQLLLPTRRELVQILRGWRERDLALSEQAPEPPGSAPDPWARIKRLERGPAAAQD